jgi:hypothetical protein
MSIVDTNIYKGVVVQEESDKTKQIIIRPNSSATTDSSLLITAAPSTDRTITLPDATDTLVGRQTNDTGANRLQNKELSDDNVRIVDSSDTTKKLAFELSGITTGNTRTLTPPNASTTIVGTDTVQDITAKTLLEVDNLQLNGNTIASLNVNGDISIIPNGTGSVQVASSNVEVDPSGNVDITGTLDIDNLSLNGNTISSSDVNGNINLSANGSGKVNVDNLALDGNTIESTDTNGNINLNPNGSGSIQLQASTVITDTTTSTTKDNGALVVEGGVGIEENLNVGGNTIITGNLTVNGTTTTLNTATLDVEDTNITVNVNGNDASAEGAGLTIERTSTDGSLVFDSALTSKFKVGLLGSEAEIVTTTGAQAISGKTQLDVDNLRLDNNTLSSTNVNGDVIIDPNGSGDVKTEAQFNMVEVSTPANPSSGYNKLYFKNDGNLYKLNSGGVESQVDATGSSATSPIDLKNLSLETSVAGNALTIALKTQSGGDPSVADQVAIAFRNNITPENSTYNVRTVTSALSIIISSGSTLGHELTGPEYIYVYALDNFGTVELAVSNHFYPDENLYGLSTPTYNTTAEGGAGGADNRFTLYSSVARTNKTLRLLGVLRSDNTPGVWVNAPKVISGYLSALTKKLPNFLNISATTTITTDDQIENIFATTGGSNITLNLPSAILNIGRRLTIKKIDSGLGFLVIDPNSSETIDSRSTINLTTQDESIIIQSNGNNWFILERYNPTIAAVYETNTAQSLSDVGSGEVIDFEDLVIDTHNAVTVGSGWIFTVPGPGYYQVSSSIHFGDAAWTVGNLIDFRIRVNGTVEIRKFYEIEASVTKLQGIEVVGIIQLATGDTVDAFLDHNRTAGSIALDGNASRNRINICRIGTIL